MEHSDILGEVGCARASERSNKKIIVKIIH